jgi:hypothetical protein
VQQESKAFFFEEKKQETFGCKRPSLIDATSISRKSFLVLFLKKERLLCSLQWWDISNLWISIVAARGKDVGQDPRYGRSTLLANHVIPRS